MLTGTLPKKLQNKNLTTAETDNIHKKYHSMNSIQVHLLVTT